MSKKILLCFSLLVTISLYPQEQENKKNLLSKVKQISLIGIKASAKLYASMWGATFISALIHEHGHALAARFLFEKADPKVTLNVHWNPMLITGFTEGKSSCSEANSPKAAIVDLAGPLAGLAACWAMLKINTFMNCYFEKSRCNVLTALRKTYKASLINHHQSAEFQTGIMMAGTAHIISLVPQSSNDGNSFIRRLLGKSLYEESPDFWQKTAGYSALGCATMGVGYAIFTNLCKRLRSVQKVSLLEQAFIPDDLDEARRELEVLEQDLNSKKLQIKKLQGQKRLLAERIVELES